MAEGCRRPRKRPAARTRRRPLARSAVEGALLSHFISVTIAGTKPIVGFDAAKGLTAVGGDTHTVAGLSTTVLLVAVS
jgi:hypothetical protein